MTVGWRIWTVPGSLRSRRNTNPSAGLTSDVAVRPRSRNAIAECLQSSVGQTPAKEAVERLVRLVESRHKGVNVLRRDGARVNGVEVQEVALHVLRTSLNHAVAENQATALPRVEQLADRLLKTGA